MTILKLWVFWVIPTKTFSPNPKLFIECVFCAKWHIYCVSFCHCNTLGERNASLMLWKEAEALPHSATSSQGHWQRGVVELGMEAKSMALKHSAGLRHETSHQDDAPLTGTQNQRHAQSTLDCTNVRKIGTSSSSSRWSAYCMATFKMWIGSSLRF